MISPEKNQPAAIELITSKDLYCSKKTLVRVFSSQNTKKLTVIPHKNCIVSSKIKPIYKIYKKISIIYISLKHIYFS